MASRRAVWLGIEMAQRPVFHTAAVPGTPPKRHHQMKKLNGA
jgi:hypothetical protein